MARMKRTGKSQPVKSGFSATASSSMAQGKGKGPSKAVAAKPAAMNEEPHTGFLPVYIHTAKCDICEKRNDSVLQRCVTCTSQFCYRCMLGGDGIHVKSNDMDWTDYGAQANSTTKAQRKTQEYVAKYKPGSPRRERSTFATGIPSCRTHHRELRDTREGTMEEFVADEFPPKAGPAPKRQKTATDKQPNLGRPAPGAKKDTRAGNAKRNGTATPQFPLIIPSQSGGYGPTFKRFLSDIRDMSDPIMTEEESDSTDYHDPRRISDFFTGPFRVPGRKRALGRRDPNPWAKEIKEHKQDIKEELALIDRRLDLLNDKKRLALVREMHIDEALDTACILMTMRSDARGFPAEIETLAFTRERQKDEALDAVHTLTSMRTGAMGIHAGTEYAFKDTPARTYGNDGASGPRTSTGMQTDEHGMPFFGETLARRYKNDEAVSAPISTGTPPYAGLDRKSVV